MPKIFRYLLPIYDITIIAYPAAGYAPHTVQFDAIVRGGAPPYSYMWDFGDGTPPSSEAKPTHTYSQTGIYTVKLTVTDSLGLAAETTTKITVLVPIGWITIAMTGLTEQTLSDVHPPLTLEITSIPYTIPTDVRDPFTLTTNITYTVPTDVQSPIDLTTGITYTVSGSVS